MNIINLIMSVSLIAGGGSPILALSQSSVVAKASADSILETNVYDDMVALYEESEGKTGTVFNPHTITPYFNDAFQSNYEDFRLFAVVPYQDDMFVYYWSSFDAFKFTEYQMYADRLKQNEVLVKIYDSLGQKGAEYEQAKEEIKLIKETMLVNPFAFPTVNYSTGSIDEPIAFKTPELKIHSTHGSDYSRFYKVQIKNVIDRTDGSDEYFFKINSIDFRLGDYYFNRTTHDQLVYNYDGGELVYNYTEADYIKITSQKLSMILKPQSTDISGWFNALMIGGLYNLIANSVAGNIGETKVDKYDETFWLHFDLDRDIDKILEVQYSYSLVTFQHLSPYKFSSDYKVYKDAYPGTSQGKEFREEKDNIAITHEMIVANKTIKPEKVKYEKEISSGIPFYKTKISAEYENIVDLNNLDDYSLDEDYKEALSSNSFGQRWAFLVHQDERKAEQSNYAWVFAGSIWKNLTTFHEVSGVTILRLTFLKDGSRHDLRALSSPSGGLEKVYILDAPTHYYPTIATDVASVIKSIFDDIFKGLSIVWPIIIIAIAVVGIILLFKFTNIFKPKKTVTKIYGTDPNKPKKPTKNTTKKKK